jgi:CBS domain-containing protein
MELNDDLEAVLDRKGHTVWFVGPEAPLQEAIGWMAEKNIGALLVIEAGVLLGVVSERDVMRRAILQARSPLTTRVREIMSSDVVVVGVRCTIQDAMALMTHHRVRHLPVVDGETITGVISIGDLVEWTIAEQKRMLDQLEQYVMGRYPS